MGGCPFSLTRFRTRRPPARHHWPPSCWPACRGAPRPQSEPPPSSTSSSVSCGSPTLPAVGRARSSCGGSRTASPWPPKSRSGSTPRPPGKRSIGAWTWCAKRLVMQGGLHPPGRHVTKDRRRLYRPTLEVTALWCRVRRRQRTCRLRLPLHSDHAERDKCERPSLRWDELFVCPMTPTVVGSHYTETRLEGTSLNKMDMIWVTVATMTYPETTAPSLLTADQIKAQVLLAFKTEVQSVMVTRHLVGSEDRQADRRTPARGGSRNRYLTRVGDRYRLYRKADGVEDGRDKTGPCCPSRDRVSCEHRFLVDWYRAEYYDA